MKLFHHLHTKLTRLGMIALLGAAVMGERTVLANPFASCITVTNNAGTTNVNFYINEGGGSVVVTFEDGSLCPTFNGTTTGTSVSAGAQSFVLNGHSGYTITCHKLGTGTPFQINSTYGNYSYYPSGRDVDTDKNPKDGSTFGRVYVGNSTPGDSGAEFKGRGIYMLTPDLGVNLAPGGGTNACAGSAWYWGNLANSASAPYRITVGPDNYVYVADYATADATVYSFDAKFAAITNIVFGPTNETAGFKAGVHGDPTGVYVTGSLATTNLVVYTWDPDLPTVYTNCLYMLDPFGNPIFNLGSEGQTTPGQFNNVCKYIIGGGTLSTNALGEVTIWTNAPNKMVSTGLPNLQDITIGSVAVETNGYVIANYARGNYSDGDIQVYDTNFNLIYTSLQPNGTDPFNFQGTPDSYYVYGGIRISPDNKYLLGLTINNYFQLCFLTNGIPDASSIMRVATSSATENNRGGAFDAADNLLEVSSGQGLLEYYSLGYTSTCVTSNDITGTNGTFFFSLPPISASLAITQPTGSQNYGTPTSAAFTITLNTNILTTPVTINYSVTGNGTNLVNFTFNKGTDANGVIINTNSVTFPAGTYPSTGNWTTTVTLTPTASPLSGPTFNELVTIVGGTTYIPAEPISGNITLYNTGPQYLLLSTAPYGATMSRAVTNDYVQFLITRYGDITVPSYTVTNFTYGGTAVFPVDYTAGAQAFTTVPVNGTPGVVIPTGASSLTNILGNPVPHSNLYEPATNVVIALSLTNAITGTNLTSFEGQAYTVNTASVALTELDNVLGSEVVLWSNPLTNSADSTNWTVTFATTAFATNTVLPVVVPNYTNNPSDNISFGGTNDYLVAFGNPVANDNVPLSFDMIANGWSTALKASVENYTKAPAGVNILPQGVFFQGNYAVRFSMYLELYDRADQNPNYSGTVDRQYAIFGMNNKGTNCDYRPTAPVYNASGGTNWDGEWFAIDAGVDAITPADFDSFASPALPNAGGSDITSNRGEAESGVFKDPPYGGVVDIYGHVGGEPVNQWVDVSAEITAGTNVNLYMNHSSVLSVFNLLSGGGYTNGTVMLGYENPLANQSDGSAYVYYSNLRVVELSPAITLQPLSIIMTNNQYSNYTFTSSANYATAPISNAWYSGTTTTTPVTLLQSTSFAGTNLTTSLTVSNITGGMGYFSSYSDVAGSVTDMVSAIEYIQSPNSVTAAKGSTVTFTVTPTGPFPPTGYTWKESGTNLVGVATFAATTNTAALKIANVTASGTYVCSVVNGSGTVTPSVVLTVVVPTPPAVSNVGYSGTNVVVAFSSTDPSASTTAFKLLSSITMNGPWTTNAAAVFTGGSGAYQVTAPEISTNATMFYKLEDIY